MMCVRTVCVRTVCVRTVCARTVYVKEYTHMHQCGVVYGGRPSSQSVAVADQVRLSSGSES